MKQLGKPMTIDELLVLASQVSAGHPKDSPEGRVCYAIQDLLAEDAPCGWEAPSVKVCVGRYGDNRQVLITVPTQWGGTVTAEEARAMARMLLVAADAADADEADKGGGK